MLFRKSLLKKLLLLCGGLVAGLAIAEGGLRIAGVSFPQPYYPDPHCGTRLQPGFRGWFLKEGRAFARINSAGFRDREHPREKPPGILRVAVLGDSYVEALQVDREEAFWSVLERRLNGCDALENRKVEVLAFGVSGWGTAQALECLRHHVWPFDPDVVLLAFVSGNDVRNNSRALEADRTRPFYVLEEGELALDDSFLEHPSYLRARSRRARFTTALVNRSHLLQVVQEFRVRRAQAASETEASANEAGLDDLCFVEPVGAAWEEAWEVTERLIQTMHREVRERGAEFQLALVSSGVQVHPDPAIRSAFARRLGVPDLFYPDRRIAALGRREGFPVITLPERMQRYAEQHQVFLHGFDNAVMGQGHWNPEGHRLAGEWIAAAICRQWETGGVSIVRRQEPETGVEQRREMQETVR